MAAGRTPKFTAEKAKKLLAAIRVGNTKKAACQSIGISEDTLARWLNGEGGKHGGRAIPGFADFSDSYARAEAEFEIKCVGTLRKAAMERVVVKRKRKTIPTDNGDMVIEEITESTEFDWQAALAWLERRRPEEWRRVDRVDLGAAANTAAEIVDIAKEVADRLKLVNGGQDAEIDEEAV